MENRPLVSVIIPVYNVDRYIDRCLESVCNQTYRRLEILLMVGLCGDGSLQKCMEWQKRDDRIIIVSRRDKGLGDARNYALKIARGKYLAYVDADDYVERTFIEKLLRPLEEDGSVTLSCCGYDMFRAPGEFEKVWVPDTDGLRDAGFEEYMRVVWGIAVWMKMYRREWILEHGIVMFEGSLEDVVVHACLAAMARSVAFVREALYHYNVGNEGALTRSARPAADCVAAFRFVVQRFRQLGLLEGLRDQLGAYIGGRLAYLLVEDKAFRSRERLEETKAFMRECLPDTYEVLFAPGRREGIEAAEHLVIFGAGRNCRRAIRCAGRENVAYIVDNDPARHGTRVEGIPVRPFSALLEDGRPALVLISSSRFCCEMARQLYEHGIRNYLQLWDCEYPDIAEAGGSSGSSPGRTPDADA